MAPSGPTRTICHGPHLRDIDRFGPRDSQRWATDKAESFLESPSTFSAGHEIRLDLVHTTNRSRLPAYPACGDRARSGNHDASTDHSLKGIPGSPPEV